jgi:hypothetical protein
MSQIRVTRFSRNTRYSVLVPNEQTFDCKVIRRVTRRPIKKGQPVQLPLPLVWEAGQ